MKLTRSAIAAHLYGLWAAIIYLCFVLIGRDKIAETFAIGSLIGGLLTAIIFSKETINAARDRTAWVRAVVFSLTQIFTIRALSSGDITGVFAASTTALLVTMPIARLVLKEPIRGVEIASAIFSIAGMMLLIPNPTATALGMAAGLFQALLIVVSKRSGLKGTSTSGDISLSLTLCGLTTILLSGQIDVRQPAFVLKALLFGAILVSTQFYFLWITRSYPTSFVSRISQTRIVWSLIVGAILQTTLPSVSAALGAVLSCFAFGPNLILEKVSATMKIFRKPAVGACRTASALQAPARKGIHTEIYKHDSKRPA